MMTKEKQRAKIQAGFGQGHGSDYRSWLYIRRKNPSPVSNQVVSWMPTLGRVAHYFSRGEYHTALLLLWLMVLDLREQFPLWPVSHPHPLTGAQAVEGQALPWSKGLLEIAREADIDHGVEIGTHIPYVATTDLMATVPFDGHVKLFGFSSKAISNPNEEVKERTLERLELERRYASDVDAGFVVTNSALVTDVLAGQLEWWLDCSTLDCAPELISKVDEFAYILNAHDDLSIEESVHLAVKRLSLSLACCWLLFRHCAWTLKIDIDPSVRVFTSFPIQHGGIALRSRLRRQFFGRDWQ